MTTRAALKPPFLSSSVRLGGVFDVGIVLMLSGSWLGLLGRWHWGLDLLSHFRWQYLAACVVAVIWTFLRRRRSVLVISLLTLMLNAGLIGRLMIEDKVEARGAALRVVSLNVLTSNPNKKVVLDYLREADADVLFLMEVDAEWAQALKGLGATYPHGVTEPQEDNFGVALLSRVPLTKVEVRELAADTMPAVEARLTHEGRELVILGIHPLPPIGPAMAARRDAELRATAEHVRRLGRPVVMVGDLNATPWSEGMRQVTASGLQLAPQSWKPTWRARSIFAIPIDHAFCSAEVGIGSKRVGPDVGSDHRPIEVDVYWR